MMKYKIYYIAILIGLLLLLLPYYITKDKILTFNTSLRIKANDKGFNKRIFDTLETEPNAKFYSCWQLPYGLPNAPGRYVITSCSIEGINEWIASPNIKYYIYWQFTPTTGQGSPPLGVVREILSKSINNLKEEQLTSEFILFSR